MNAVEISVRGARLRDDRSRSPFGAKPVGAKPVGAKPAGEKPVGGKTVGRGLAVGAFLLLLLIPFTARPARSDERTDSILTLLELVLDADADSARECLGILADQIQSGEIQGKQLERLQPRLEQLLKEPLREDSDHPLRFEASALAAGWRHPPSLRRMRRAMVDTSQSADRRLAALKALVAAGGDDLLKSVSDVLGRPEATPLELRGEMLAALGSMEAPGVADVVLQHFAAMEPPLRPKAVELLIQRGTWSKALMRAIQEDRVPADALHHNQVARLLASRDEELVQLVRTTWGTVRTERDPQREAVLARMRDLLQTAAGSPDRGREIFHKVCGQCHRIHGQGQQVGPDITANGRGTFDQLLSNVFDPSLVIGSAYQARTVITAEGRILTGLLVEDSPRRLVLKLQGGKQEIIPRDDVDELQVSRLSLMPEGLEKQLQPQELADLFAFLVLDGPPDDPKSGLISGAPPGLVSDE